jgi:type IV secretion system protein VirB9
MDPRRFMIPALAPLVLGGCADLPSLRLPHPSPTPATASTLASSPPALDAVARDASPQAADPPAPRRFAAMAPIADAAVVSQLARADATPPTVVSGPTAIAAANARAREGSRAAAFVGGIQVFTYDPGRVYEVWTAPLRVTTLTLSPGETLVSKAAGDTVRWQIGETRSGEGDGERTHVLIKPLERGLETNLVLATSRRVYLIQLRRGAPAAFNAAVAWDLGAVWPRPAAEVAAAVAPAPLASPQGPLDAGFRIAPKGRRPAWTPTVVMTDGVHTFLAFPPGLRAGEAPALFARSANGRAQLVNYRQRGDLWVVD